MSTGEDTVRRLKQTNCILEAALLLAPLPVLRRCKHFTTIKLSGTHRHDDTFIARVYAAASPVGTEQSNPRASKPVTLEQGSKLCMLALIDRMMTVTQPS
jgi:hypothetical protein